MKTETPVRWVRPEDLPEGTLKNFGLAMASQPVGALIRNVETELRILEIAENLFFPVSVNYTEWYSSYVCSPYTAYVLYARDEISRKIKNGFVRWPLQMSLRLISGWLKSAGINRNVHVNNFLLSTNPYPDWQGAQIQSITDFLIREYPGHAIIFRSLNVRQHGHLLSQFKKNNYLLLGSRQVYLYNDPFESWIRHNNNRQDRRIVRNSKLHYMDHDAMRGCLAEAVHLYNLLYLEKYSRHNPQFTLAYFERMHENGTIHFQGYTDAQGRLRAFAGLFVIGSTITSPLVGYDTAAPVKESLYIHAMQLIFGYKHKTGKLLNLSSGAPRFKRLRGGVPAIEYSAVYVSHLTGRRQRMFRIMRLLTQKIGVPLLEKYEL